MKSMLKFMALIMIVILSIGGLVGCKKEAVKTDAEKVFTLEKTTETPPKSTNPSDELQYVLYLKVEDTMFLGDELVTVPESDRAEAEVDLALYALKKLLATTSIRNLVNPIPAGTTLIKLEKIDGLAKVSLSNSFLATEILKEDAQLAVAAIVNTLTYFSEIDTVEIYVDEKRLNSYFGIDITEPQIFFDGLYPDK